MLVPAFIRLRSERSARQEAYLADSYPWHCKLLISVGSLEDVYSCHQMLHCALQVADFGLSRVLSQEAVSTGTFGTVTHMPPELLTTGRLSKSVDVYAFGVLLWEMCTGKRPWAGMMQMQVYLGCEGCQR